MAQPLVSEPCDTPDRVTIFMNVTDRPYFGRFLTTIADADERRMTTRRYRRRRRSNGRSRTYPVTVKHLVELLAHGSLLLIAGRRRRIPYCLRQWGSGLFPSPGKPCEHRGRCPVSGYGHGPDHEEHSFSQCDQTTDIQTS